MNNEIVKIVDSDSSSGFREVTRDQLKPGDIKYIGGNQDINNEPAGFLKNKFKRGKDK